MMDVWLSWKSFNNERVPAFLSQHGWMVKQETGRLRLDTARAFKLTGLLSQAGMLRLVWRMRKLGYFINRWDI